MNDEINGNVSVLINGKSYNVSVSKGKGTVEIKDEIAVGKYDAVATFDGDDKYSSATSQTSFNVTKKDINLGVDAKNIVEGDVAIINVNLMPDADGEISVVIAGKSYTAKANNGIATVEIPDLPIGAYDFTVEYKKDSKLRDLMIEIYKEQYNEEPKVEAIHAGLECGMFAGKIAGLDCVSIGPNLSQIHTVRESMNIPSVQRVYAFVLETLKRMKA